MCDDRRGAVHDCVRRYVTQGTAKALVKMSDSFFNDGDFPDGVGGGAETRSSSPGRKKSPAKRSPAKKSPAKKSPAKKSPAPKKSAPKKRAVGAVAGQKRHRSAATAKMRVAQLIVKSKLHNILAKAAPDKSLPGLMSQPIITERINDGVMHVCGQICASAQAAANSDLAYRGRVQGKHLILAVVANGPLVAHLRSVRNIRLVYKSGDKGKQQHRVWIAPAKAKAMFPFQPRVRGVNQELLVASGVPGCLKMEADAADNTVSPSVFLAHVGVCVAAALMLELLPEGDTKKVRASTVGKTLRGDNDSMWALACGLRPSAVTVASRKRQHIYNISNVGQSSKDAALSKRSSNYASRAAKLKSAERSLQRR